MKIDVAQVTSSNPFLKVYAFAKPLLNKNLPIAVVIITNSKSKTKATDGQ